MAGVTPPSLARQLERIDAIRAMIDSSVGQSGAQLSELAGMIGDSLRRGLSDIAPPLVAQPIDEKKPEPSLATPPTGAPMPPPPTTAGPPNIAPTPPSQPSGPTEQHQPTEKVATFWDGDETHIPTVTIDAPFAGQMGTGYRVYADEDGKPNLVQVRENEHMLAQIEFLPNGNYLYTLMGADNLAGVYEVSPDGTSVTVRQSIPALWDKWGDFITGPDPRTTGKRGVALEFLAELGAAATSPRETPPDLPSPGAVGGPSNSSNTLGTAEYSKRQRELALDPAEGKISDPSMREAAVGLEAERNGSIPGPITRAQLGSGGEDMGEFIDAEGTRWDVKSSPDVAPFYSKVAGKPINPQSDEQFIIMINKDIATGEKILLDPVGMTTARQAHIRNLILSHPEWYDQVVWVNMGN